MAVCADCVSYGMGTIPFKGSLFIAICTACVGGGMEVIMKKPILIISAAVFAITIIFFIAYFVSNNNDSAISTGEDAATGLSDSSSNISETSNLSTLSEEDATTGLDDSPSNTSETSNPPIFPAEDTTTEPNSSPSNIAEPSNPPTPPDEDATTKPDDSSKNIAEALRRAKNGGGNSAPGNNGGNSFLTFDTPELIPLDENGTSFYVYKKIDALKGTIADTGGVSAMTLVITCGNLEIVNAPITPAKNWSYPNPVLTLFNNQITVSVVMNDGTIIEKSISVINDCEENFDESTLDTADNDGDGLLNWLEDIYETEKDKPDTDGDGLNDYAEIFITFTSPRVYDSDENGISDGDEDFDGDKLTNAQECFNNTNPFNPDTDKDGLSDYDELFVYKTEPFNPDTDGDGLTDSDDIALGFDPLKPKTFGGILDSEYFVSFEMTKDELSAVNNRIKEFDIVITAKATSNFRKHLTYYADPDNVMFSDNKAIIGAPIRFDYDEGNVKDFTITFYLSEKYINSNKSYYPDLNLGIERYSVFFFDEEVGAMLPVACSFNEADNSVTMLENPPLGTYFLIDLEKLAYDLGMDFPAETD